MIASLVLVIALSQNANPVTEVVDPSAKIVSVVAIVKLPTMGAHEYAEAKLLAETMANEVDGYSQSDMKDMAARAGESRKITLMPDHLRIQVGALPAEATTAVNYIGHILRKSRLPEDALTKAEAEIPFRTRSLWATAIEPVKYDFHRIKRDDVVDLYHRLCRPDNVWLSVGGPVDATAIETAWNDATRDWTVGRLPRWSPDPKPVGEIQDVPGSESMIELRGKEFLGDDPAMPTKILALIGLGSGKGSAMFARLRQTKAWSYRQETILWPTTQGFEPRLIMASGDQTPPMDLANAMKDELVDAVKSWDQSDLSRAEGMAQGIFERGFTMSPLYFNPSWPVTSSLDDRTFLAGYWTMKTGRPWNSSTILGSMALVSLSDFKDAALDILNSSQPHVLTAHG